MPIPLGHYDEAFQRALNRFKSVVACSFNDHSLRKLHETSKDAVDPNGILSAGRYGISPKHLRKA
jgi:hypothetical protein